MAKQATTATRPPKKPPQPGRDHRGYFAKGNSIRLGLRGEGYKYPGDEKALEVVVDIMGQGGTKAMVAMELSVSRGTIETWQNNNPAFRSIMDIGETLAQAWLEQVALDGLHDRSFQAHLWKFMMCARFRDDYVDRQEVSLPEVANLIKEIHDRNEKLTGVGKKPGEVRMFPARREAVPGDSLDV